MKVYMVYNGVCTAEAIVLAKDQYRAVELFFDTYPEENRYEKIYADELSDSTDVEFCGPLYEPE